MLYSECRTYHWCNVMQHGTRVSTAASFMKRVPRLSCSLPNPPFMTTQEEHAWACRRGFTQQVSDEQLVEDWTPPEGVRAEPLESPQPPSQPSQQMSPYTDR